MRKGRGIGRGTSVAVGLVLLFASVVSADGVLRDQPASSSRAAGGEIPARPPKTVIDTPPSSPAFDLPGPSGAQANRPRRSVLPCEAERTAERKAQVEPAANPQHLGSGGPRQGGDTCEMAFVIDSLPFTAAGTTVGYADDYSQECMMWPSPANDVVYQFSPTQDMSVHISLCNPETNFENALFVYDGICTPDAMISCNEAVCATESEPYGGVAEIECISVTANTVYYIVIDGSWGGEGDYVIDVEECTPCALECSPESIPEGETNCHPGYVDTYNVGCSGSDKLVSSISCGDTVCGTSGTYYSGMVSSDMDWYELVLADDAELTITFQAQFRAMLALMANGGVDDCSVFGSTGPRPREVFRAMMPCEPINTTMCLPAGVHWIALQPMDGGVSCDRIYELSIDCSPCDVPLGSCCLADGTCMDNLPAMTCYEYYGSLIWNEGLDCASTTCPPRLVGPTCDDAVEVDVPSVVWGTVEGAAEVTVPDCGFSGELTQAGSWHKVVGSGNRMTATTCNARGFGGSGEMSVFCAGCATPMCAADMAYQEQCEGSSHTGNTVTWCSELGQEYYIWLHSRSAAYRPYDFILEVYDDGIPCDDYPVCELPSGACCLGDVCYGDNMEQAECDAVGGRLYPDEDCATFTCPNDCPGDTWQTAIQIPELPYHGDGNTVPCMDHYLQMCEEDYWGYSNDSRDVVYQYTPTQDVIIDVSLCRNSKMNTKLSVFENVLTASMDPGTALACSNDACTSPSWIDEGTVSRIDCLELFAGSTYYFVIDGGFFSYRAYYTIDVTEAECALPPCDVTCDAGSTPEGEPAIEDDYVDNYNSGCLAATPVFSSISCGETICGSSGTYAVGGSPGYRDTDWYSITVTEDTEFVVSLTAEFDAFYGFIDNNGIADCDLATTALFTGAEAEACEATDFTTSLPAGEWWIVVLPQAFEGLPPPLEYELSLTCNPCVTTDGACCVPVTGCVMADENECSDLGGEFEGAGTTCDPSPCPVIPENDDCVDATLISSPSQTLGSTLAATVDTLAGQSSEFGVWYKIVGTGNTIVLSTCNEVTNFDTQITVVCKGCNVEERSYVHPQPIEAFPGEEVSPYQLNDSLYRSDDDWFCRDHSLLASTYTLCSERGAEYWVVVHGYNGAQGDFRLDIIDEGESCVDSYNESCATAPANDDCAAAEPIGDVVELFWNTSFASDDGPVGGPAGPNVWYCYTASCSGTTTVTWEQMPGLSFDSAVAVYDGCTCAPLGQLLVSHQSGEPREVSFDVVAGQSYLIMVGSWTGLGGAGSLTVQCALPAYGACCMEEAPYCTETYEHECAGTFVGDGTVCDLNDCNSNGMPDTCDIAIGVSDDCNGNGIPDDCELCGDLDEDGDVDYDDYVIFLDAFGGEVDGDPSVDRCCDYDNTGAVGLADYDAWLDCYRDFIGDPLAGPPTDPNGDSLQTVAPSKKEHKQDTHSLSRSRR